MLRTVSNEPLLAKLLAYVKKKTLVLILDNCEHVVEEAARLAEALLRGCPRVRIIATSREPLRIAGERSYRLPPLAFPTPQATRALRADEADAYGAIALFVERAQAVDDRFTLTDEHAPIVAEICRRLDGIPLAIELAAARANVLSPRQLRDRLDERFRLLTGGSRDLLPRHQTLRALLDWSYDLLDDRERALLRRLGVFVNGFALEGAVAVGSGDDLEEGDVFDVLVSLVNKSLVQAEADGDALRYRMLESTRAYAREKLEAAGELADSVTRHQRCLRDLFAAARRHAERSGRLTEIDALLVAELDDARAALDGFADSARLETAAELRAAIDSRWLWVGLGSEGSARLERFISLMPPDERRLTSWLWTALARIAATANPVRALEAALRAGGLARDANDPETLAYALTMYADSLAGARAFEDAAAALAEAEALAPARNVWLRLRILGASAFLATLTGDLDAAAQAREQLRKTHLQLGNVSDANRATFNLAELEHLRGQTERAVSLTQEMLPALRISRDRPLLLNGLANLYGYLVALDRLSEARDVAREAFQNTAEHNRNGMPVTCAIEHAALAVALDGYVRRGAQLAGYTQAAFSRIGYNREYTEHTTRTRLEALLHLRLAPVERASLLAQGAALSAEDAIALVLASLDE